MDKLRYNITKIVFENYKNKIVKSNNLNYYLNTLSTDDIKNIIQKYYIVSFPDDFYKYVVTLNLKSKEQLIKIVCENYKEILKALLLPINSNYLLALNELIDNYHEKINYEEISIINLFIFLENNKLMRIKNNKDSITIYIPEFLLKDINSLINNKSFIRENKKIFNKENNIFLLLNVYSVLSINDLYNIYNKTFTYMSYNKLLNIIYILCIFNEEYNIVKYNDTILISLHKDEDETLCFYESLENIDYNILSKKEYISLEEQTYFDEDNDYKNLLKYIQDNFYCDENDLNYIKDILIYDFIEIANENQNIDYNLFKKKFNEIFINTPHIIKLKTFEYITKLIKKYPVNYLKGNTLNNYNKNK